MPCVKCGVDGYNTRLQPVLKPDPRDRESWVYREGDVCFRPACEKHATAIDGRIVCARCRRAMESRRAKDQLIDLGVKPFSRRPWPAALPRAGPSPCPAAALGRARWQACRVHKEQTLPTALNGRGGAGA